MTTRGRPARRLRVVRERPTLSDATTAFLAQPDLATSSRRSYAQTLGRLQAALGEDHLVDRVGGSRYPTHSATRSAYRPLKAPALDAAAA